MNDDHKNKEDTEVREEPRVMTKDDVHDYQGLTLNEDGQEEKKEEEEGYTIHIRSFSLKKIPLWKKALFAAGLVACAIIFIMLVHHAGHSSCLLLRSRRCHHPHCRWGGVPSEEIYTVKYCQKRGCEKMFNHFFTAPFPLRL